MEQATSSLKEITNKLKLPAKSFDSLSFCSLEQEQIQAHINNLPYTNPPELCRQLYESLPQVAGLSIGPARKLAILDAFLPAVMNCVDKLTFNTAINEKTARSISLAQALLKHLAEGYKSTAVEASRSEEVIPKLLASSIFSAMSVLNRSIFNCWQCYLATPENFWPEVHNLYKLARKFNLETQAVTLPGSSQQVALRSAYLKPLLMSSINPGRYTPADLRTIFQELDQLTNLVDLRKGHEMGVFVVDTASSNGPVYSSRVQSTTANHLTLRTNRLVAALKMDADHDPGTARRLPERLAINLCQYWDEEQVRKDEHVDDDTEVLAIIGLAPIQRLMSRTSDLDEFLLKLDQAQHGKDYSLFSDRKPTYLQDKAQAEDAWHDSFDSTDRKFSFADRKKPEDEAIDFEKVEIKRKTERKKIRGYYATRVNTSSRGACIEFREPPANLTPGELIYLKEKASDQWRLGFIRWLQVTPRLYRLAGVEFLSGNIKPCAACIVKLDRPSSPYLPGLILINGNQTEAILPSMPFKVRQRVKFLTMESDKICPLRKVLDTTFHVTRFQYLAGVDSK